MSSPHASIPIFAMSHAQLAEEAYYYCAPNWSGPSWDEYCAEKSVEELRRLVAQFRGARWLRHDGVGGTVFDG